MVGYLGQTAVYKPVQDAERLHSLEFNGAVRLSSDGSLMAVCHVYSRSDSWKICGSLLW
jgi:hypothetical protein